MDGFNPQGPLAFTVESLAQESMRFQAKLRAGLDTLRQVEDVDYGATTREEVWRDRKTVMYRFRGDRPATARVPLLIV